MSKQPLKPTVGGGARPHSTPSLTNTEFLLYQTEDGQTRIEVRMTDETVWLNLMQMSELFGRDKSVISRHIRNLFEEGELQRDSVVANLATTAADAKIDCWPAKRDGRA